MRKRQKLKEACPLVNFKSIVSKIIVSKTPVSYRLKYCVYKFNTFSHPLTSITDLNSDLSVGQQVETERGHAHRLLNP